MKAPSLGRRERAATARNRPYIEYSCPHCRPASPGRELGATLQGRTFSGMDHGKKKFSSSREVAKKGPPLGLVIALAAASGVVIGSAGTYFFPSLWLRRSSPLLPLLAERLKRKPSLSRPNRSSRPRLSHPARLRREKCGPSSTAIGMTHPSHVSYARKAAATHRVARRRPQHFWRCFHFRTCTQGRRRTPAFGSRPQSLWDCSRQHSRIVRRFIVCASESFTQIPSRAVQAVLALSTYLETNLMNAHFSNLCRP
jgi:hypothetical protein